MSSKILFVDDETHTLEAFQRVLREEFQISTAISGPLALEEIRQNGPYAVVVSDMKMPGMNGIQLLSRVRQVAPQTVRVVLTGHADIETAMNAVNEDAVFRFLTKPCSAAVLKKTLTACLLQYRMATAERELVENTLLASINVLTNMLNLANPAAFGRALRIRRYVQHVVRELQLESSWKYEAAAMLSQLGCITLEPELLEAAYRGEILPPEEQARFNKHPVVARELLADIPRLEGIAWVVGQQLEAAGAESTMSDSMNTGAAILQIAIAFDKLKEQTLTDQQAIAELLESHKTNIRIVRALQTLRPFAPAMETRVVSIVNLKPGMIVDEELRSTAGLLLASKGQEVNSALVVRLSNFHRRGTIKNEVLVLAVPAETPKQLAAGASG